MNPKTLKVLVPIIAVIVLVESVLLISGLQKKSQSKNVGETVPVPTVKEVENKVPPVYTIDITADKTELKKGKAQKVDVIMQGDSDRALDSVNIYVKYDPSAFDVPKLSFDKKLPQPAFSKVSTSRGMLVANFLISDPKGLRLAAGEKLTAMSFNIVPKKSGNFNFEISTGNEMKESATMIVENATSKVLPISGNKLTVNVSE